MAERYTRLYSLPQNLYSPGSPVVISSGTLVSDSMTGRNLAQVSFRSISSGSIVSLSALFIGRDAAGAETCRVEHLYQEITAGRGALWGAKDAVHLPPLSTCSFSVELLSVDFADGSSCCPAAQSWLPLPPQQPLEARLFDAELIRQYRINTTKKSEYIPLEAGELWLCSCGEINHSGEACFSCGQELSLLKEQLNVETLRREKAERLHKHAEAEAETEKFRESTKKKLKTALLIFIPLAVVAAGLITWFTISDRRTDAYESACALYEAGNYSEAAEAFELLGDYKDSAEKAALAGEYAADISAYAKASRFLENGRYDDAYATFTSMGDYQDSAELALESLYRKAAELTAEGFPEEAIALYLQLGDYKDSAEAAEHFVYRVSSETCSADAETGAPLTTEYTYDSAGRILTKTALYSAYPGRSDREYVYSYAEDGSYTVTQDKNETSYDAHGSFVGLGKEVRFVYEYGKTADDCLYCGCYLPDTGGFVSETVYDEYGNKAVFTDTDGSVYKYLNEYDEEGRLIRQESCDPHGAVIDRTEYAYSGDGLLPARKTFMGTDGSTAVTEYTYVLIYAPDTQS